MEIFGQAPLQVILFIVIYSVTGVVPLFASLYLLLRQGNAFAADVTPLAMFQDRRGPVWPIFVAMIPIVAIGGMLMAGSNELLAQIAVAYIVLLYVLFTVYVVFAVILFVVYMVYTTNAGELMREYLSQVISIVTIAFLVWRVETLQELESE